MIVGATFTFLHRESKESDNECQSHRTSRTSPYL